MVDAGAIVRRVLRGGAHSCYARHWSKWPQKPPGSRIIPVQAYSSHTNTPFLTYGRLNCSSESGGSLSLWSLRDKLLFEPISKHVNELRAFDGTESHKTKRAHPRRHTKQMPFISVCQNRSSANVCLLAACRSVGNFAWVIIAEVRGFDHSRTPALNWSFLPLIRLQLLCSACPFWCLLS